MGNNMDKIFIVMEYVEHDLKALMETMTQPFLQGELSDLSSVATVVKQGPHTADLKAIQFCLNQLCLIVVGWQAQVLA